MTPNKLSDAGIIKLAKPVGSDPPEPSINIQRDTTKMVKAIRTYFRNTLISLYVTAGSVALNFKSTLFVTFSFLLTLTFKANFFPSFFSNDASSLLETKKRLTEYEM